MHIEEASPDYMARLFVLNDDPVIRGGMWTRHRNGVEPFEPVGFAVGVSLPAEVYAGMWIVRCQSEGCRNSHLTSRHDNRFFCTHCLNAAAGGQWIRVTWPADVERKEAVLLTRPAPNMHMSTETLAELVEENRAHAAPVPAGVI